MKSIAHCKAKAKSFASLRSPPAVPPEACARPVGLRAGTRWRAFWLAAVAAPTCGPCLHAACGGSSGAPRLGGHPRQGAAPCSAGAPDPCGLGRPSACGLAPPGCRAGCRAFARVSGGAAPPTPRTPAWAGCGRRSPTRPRGGSPRPCARRAGGFAPAAAGPPQGDSPSPCTPSRLHARARSQSDANPGRRTSTKLCGAMSIEGGWE